MHTKMLRKSCISLYLLLLFLVCDPLNAVALKSDDVLTLNNLVTKEERRTIVLTESGQISAVDINDGYRGPYHLQFITLEPNSLFLPVLLQTDMVFFVHTGRGQLGWVDDGDMHHMDLQRGDIYGLGSGSIFYFQSHAEPTREKLRMYAFFTNKIKENSHEPFIGAYSNLSDLVLGFDKRVLQMAFQVSEEVIEGITEAGKPPSIIHMTTKNETEELDWQAGIIEALVGGGYSHSLYNGKKKNKAYNILRKKPDVENCNGWSLAVNHKDFHALKDSDIGLFMVNLSKGSMMGPHWNPRASEIAIVTHGQGMVRVVCASNAPNCKNARFRVKEGDVFAVSRFHPMAQISFNDDSLVFMGFSTMARNNRPQFLAGKRSVLLTIDEEILAMSFNVPNTTIREFLSAQAESIILECASCAEDEEKKMEEEIEKKRQEEEARKRQEEEEAKKREEEEKERKRQEEEEAKKREEEEKEARKRKEEEEEARKRKEEEEEARKRKEEEEARKRHEEEEEEEARKREEEEKQKQEEEARKREEEEKQRQEEEARREQEEARRQEEERQARQREEEEARRQEEERKERKRQEEEESRREEEEARRREEEEEARRQEDERKREEAARRREEEEGGHGGGGGGEEMKVWKKMWKI